MPAKRLPMRKIREALRLSWGAWADSAAGGGEPGLARSTVAEYVGGPRRPGLAGPCL